jgi:hypothetical protein
MCRAVVAAVLLSLALGGAARADFDVQVTALPGFAAGLTRVAVLAVACHDSVDCGQVEDAAAEELTNRKPAFAVVPPSDLREKLFARGSTTLTDELRQSILDELGVDGVLEIEVPFASRGDGFGGSRRSEVRVEVRLLTRAGELRMTGRGTGRPKNVVSGTERVAGTVVEKILLEAFGRR